MYYVNREQIDRRLSFIDEVAETARRVANCDLDNSVYRFAAERAIHLAAECITDIGSYMIDGFVMRDASSYEDIVDILYGESVFGDDLYPLLTSLVRMRKPLVQEYDRAGREEVARLIPLIPHGLPGFAAAVRDYLDRESGGGAMKLEQEMTTRRMLLTMLKTSGALSIGEMARRLSITEMAVRRHMNTMERDGLVSTTLVRQAMGRPAYLFALTEEAEYLFPKNYHGLTLDLLDELTEVADGDAVSQLFERRKNKLVRRYRPRMQTDVLQEKVEALAAIQNDNGYMAIWEQDVGGGGYTIDEFNCPISQVADKYNHACQSELELFRELLGTEVDRVECLAKDGRRCRYLIRKQSE